LCLAGGLISGVFLHDTAHAYDHGHPELNKWFESLKSGKGLCCDGKDAVHVADPDWETKNGHYRVRLDVSSETGKVDMEWIDVPDEAVIPSRTFPATRWCGRSGAISALSSAASCQGR
jgi:hypothetical protein